MSEFAQTNHGNYLQDVDEKMLIISTIKFRMTARQPYWYITNIQVYSEILVTGTFFLLHVGSRAQGTNVEPKKN